MKRFHVSLLASAVFVLGTAAGLVRADVILVPTATDNGHYDDGNGNISPASNTVDGSGLSTPSLVSNGASVPVTWPTNNASVDGPGFLRSYVAYLNSNVVTYTFASAVNISGGHFWQYGGDDTARCLKTADIYVSSNGTDYSMNGTLTPGYEESATATQDPGVDFTLTATNVRSIQLRNLTPYAANAQNMVGFGEIRFVGTIPEPNTLILLATSLIGLLAYAWRKRK